MGTHLEQLQEKVAVIVNLTDCRRLLHWDQQVVMPPGGGEARSSQLATLSRVAHEFLVSDDFLRALEAAEKEVEPLDPDSDERCLVREARRQYTRSAGLPAELVEEETRACALGVEAWKEAKRGNDFAMFRPHLKKIFALKVRIAECRGYQEHPYDALLDDFEAGMTTAEVRRLFDGLRPRLVSLVSRIAESRAVPQQGPLEQSFDVKQQKILARELAAAIGYDFMRGRLDESAHPFCSAPSSLDVRITTRFRADRLGTSMFGSLHETGHALYEQGSPRRFEGSFLRGGCSLGVHESQSRLWENMVGRSRAFWLYHYPRLRSMFPAQLSGYTIEDWYRAINRVRPSLIRVEADEVTYSLHVILRLEIELALLDGSLKVEDLPEVWNDRMEEYLGLRPPDDAQGCLQDIHWSDGLIGYFPTYSLGNMIAAQLWERITVELPDLDRQIERGDCRPLRDWLQEHVYQHASKFEPRELVLRATGKPLNSTAFVDYLERKYSDIYALMEPTPIG